MTTRPAHKLSYARLPFWLPPLFFLLLAACFLWRSTFAGDVFLPATLLGHVAPWTADARPDTLPPWNPLRWDGIAQFYPWRHFAHESIRTGTLPLWNPYQFCGTPFVANSQSAVFYPPNLLFYLLPTDRAFGLSALLHLTLCGWFTYLLLRRVGCGEVGALFGGIVFAFSAWQVQWLQLPTFLATSCWFPLLLRQIYEIGKWKTEDGRRKSNPAPTTQHAVPQSLPIFNFRLPSSVFPLACIVGLMLLAGHLQIAFYGLLAGSLWGIALLGVRGRQHGAGFVCRRLSVLVGGLILGAMLALPQILPALELSGMSHRAGKPSAGGYALYVEYALPSADLAMLTLPEFFGNDYDPNNPYYGYYVKHLPDGQGFAVRHNAAETAIYVGVLPLLLAILAVIRASGKAPGKTNSALPGTEVPVCEDSRASLTILRTEERAITGDGPCERASPADLQTEQTLEGCPLSISAKRAWDLKVWFFAGLAVLALLLALGTPLNALFYFLIPGFGQSGSPARCLVLWALAVAVLSAFGLDSLLRQPPAKREAGIVAGVFLLLFAIGLSLASQSLQADVLQLAELKVPVFGEVITRIGFGWARLALFAIGGCALLFSAGKTAARKEEEEKRRKGEEEKTEIGQSSIVDHQYTIVNPEHPNTEHRTPFSVFALALIIADLFLTGISLNPTAPPSAVYPVTPGIQYVQEHVGHDRVWPVNKFWSLVKPPPAVFPPNAGMVYGLHDVQGYDSLLTGQYKTYANGFARLNPDPTKDQTKDASPPEVGNMVFLQDPNLPAVPELGATYALTLAASSPYIAKTVTPATGVVYDALNEMAVYPLPNARGRAYLTDKGGSPLAGSSTVAFQQDAPTRVVLAVTAAAPSDLILADQFYPGWHVTVDGKAAPLQRSPNGVFRAVAVSTGAHVVTFRYDPGSFRVGLYLACFACCLLAGLGGVQWIGRRR